MGCLFIAHGTLAASQGVFDIPRCLQVEQCDIVSEKIRLHPSFSNPIIQSPNPQEAGRPLTVLDFSQIPSMPPPPGVTSNFVNPENNSSILIIVCTICLVFLLLFVSLRMYTRLWISRSFGLDDGTHPVFTQKSKNPMLLTDDC